MIKLFHSKYTIHKVRNTQKWYIVSGLNEGQC